MATPANGYREGSVGIPMPDVLAKVVRFGTTDEVPHGEDGELCIYSPSIMRGYLGQPEATARALQTHADGRVWLHTGDVFSRDPDGYFYFKVRIKRMITIAGTHVYPPEVEGVLYKHPEVRNACVIGVPDPAEGERVKAVVVLNDPSNATIEMQRTLISYCAEKLRPQACPREIEFRDSLPMTPVGKVAYTVLVQDELAKRGAVGSSREHR
jgi:long-chain acyl-CoA synthetase